MALTQIIQRSDKIYYLGHDYEGYVFVDLSDTAPPYAWTEGLPFFESKETEEQVKQNRVEVPSQAGRSIARSTSHPSPDGNYLAAFDGEVLTVTRARDGAVVAQVRRKNFHGVPGNDYQRMNVAGWTDDSRQIIFLVETNFNARRSLAQVFALTVAE